MANITTTEASGFIPEIWLATALGYLRNNITIAKMVTKDSDLEGGTFNVGQTLHIPKRGVITVRDKTQGSPYTTDSPSSSTVDITLNKHKYIRVGIEDRANSVANQQILEGYVQDGMAEIAEQIDSDLFALHASVSAGNTITNASNISEANVAAARKLLVDNKAGNYNDFYGVVTTGNRNALAFSTNTARYDATGRAGNLVNAEVGNGSGMAGSFGKFADVNLFESQLVPQVGSSPVVAKNLVFTKDAIVLATRALKEPPAGTGVKSAVMRDPESGIIMRLLYGYDFSYGATVAQLDVLYGLNFQRAEHCVLINTLP